MAKKKKNEEKRQRKLAGKNAEAPVADQQTSAETGAETNDGAIGGNA